MIFCCLLFLFVFLIFICLLIDFSKSFPCLISCFTCLFDIWLVLLFYICFLFVSSVCLFFYESLFICHYACVFDFCLVFGWLVIICLLVLDLSFVFGWFYCLFSLILISSDPDLWLFWYKNWSVMDFDFRYLKGSNFREKKFSQLCFQNFLVISRELVKLKFLKFVNWTKLEGYSNEKLVFYSVF